MIYSVHFKCWSRHRSSATEFSDAREEFGRNWVNWLSDFLSLVSDSPALVQVFSNEQNSIDYLRNHIPYSQDQMKRFGDMNQGFKTASWKSIHSRYWPEANDWLQIWISCTWCIEVSAWAVFHYQNFSERYRFPYSLIAGLYIDSHLDCCIDVSTCCIGDTSLWKSGSISTRKSNIMSISIDQWASKEEWSISKWQRSLNLDAFKAQCVQGTQ
jgi:hypothetical protein